MMTRFAEFVQRPSLKRPGCKWGIKIIVSLSGHFPLAAWAFVSDHHAVLGTPTLPTKLRELSVLKEAVSQVVYTKKRS